jgi:hypothetical protein
MSKNQKGSLTKRAEKKVYYLKNSLYELKQTPRAWNALIDGYLEKKIRYYMTSSKHLSI